MASRLFENTLINGQGIIGRAIISRPKRLTRKRPHKVIDLTLDAKFLRYQQRITALLQKPGHFTRVD